MRTRTVCFNNKEALIIYTDRNERYTQKLEDFIIKSKEHYEDVIIFVSGSSELKVALHALTYDKYNAKDF